MSDDSESETDDSTDTDSESESGVDTLDHPAATTAEASVRWPFTNDLLAGVLVCGALLLVALYALGVATAEPPRFLTDAIAMGVVTAIGWAFGPATYKELKAAKDD